ncbi:MAG: acetyltransferase [Alistipes sp.]|nr:acetyltransferase [Alistipes sp.]
MIDLGKQLTTGTGCRIEAFLTGDDKRKKIKFGNRVQINDRVHISALDSVEIGNDVLIASHVYISDNTHGSYSGDFYDTPPCIPPAERPYATAPVKIGDRVWIGEGVIVMPGATIGSGSVIGAHSIVKGDIPADTIAAGTPARPIKRWNSDSGLWERTI